MVKIKSIKKGLIIALAFAVCSLIVIAVSPQASMNFRNYFNLTDVNFLSTSDLTVKNGVNIDGGHFTWSGSTDTLVLNNTVGTYNTITSYGNINGYFQMNIKNTNNGSSGDYIITANNGDETNNYIDMGINNQNYSDPLYNMGVANDGYLYVQNGSLDIATASPNKNIQFFTGGTTIDKLRVSIDSVLNITNLNITTNTNGAKIGTNATNCMIIYGATSELWVC